MKLGASTKSFGGMTPDDTARIFARSGLECAELCFCQSELSGWRYNLTGYEKLPSADDIIRACDTFRACGTEVCAIGIYNCFLWQKPSELYDSVRLFTEYCDAAYLAGIKMVTTHSGTPGFRSPDGRSLTRMREKVYDGFALACTEAEKRGITVAVECSAGDIITDRGGFMQLKEHIRQILGRSDMLKYICSPIDDRVPYDLSDVPLCHIKDRKSGGRFYERFGDGDGDFTAFFREAEKYTDMPMILEYINSGNVDRTVQELKRYTEKQI